MPGMMVESLTNSVIKSVHWGVTKSVHRSESVCDEDSVMNDMKKGEEMWMKRVRSVGDTRGCERLMWDVMTNDEESVMTRVKRREERECEECWGGVGVTVVGVGLPRDRILPQIRSPSIWIFSPSIWIFSPSIWNFGPLQANFSPLQWFFKIPYIDF